MSAASTLRLYCPRLFDGEQMLTDVVLSLVDGRVAAMEPNAMPESVPLAQRLAPGSIVSPGLVDVQVNGGGGALFNDDPSPATIQRIGLAHGRHGTTTWLPTLITDTRARIAQAIEAVRQTRGDGIGVAGIHLEGPFLQPARRGIHQAELIAEWQGRDDEHALTALGRDGCTLITLAPEQVDAGAVARLRLRGAHVSAGHTAASYEQVKAALDEGLDGFTHLFNAMPPVSGRSPGPVVAALLAPQAYAGLVLDGHHVAPASVALVRAARGFERVLLVSDAMPPAGTDDTEFELQGQTIRVVGGRCIDAAGTLAGAAITLSDAVRIAMQQYGFSLEEALASATRIPARMLGLDVGRLAPGRAADLVVWDAAMRPQGVMQGGAWIRHPSADPIGAPT